MSTDVPDANESIDLDDRDVRALTECLTVLPEAPDLYRVVSESGSAYTVDAREGVCECPDAQYRDVRCKHVRRVAFATGERAIPAWVDATAIDAHLGEHVDATPRLVATDGGIIEAGDEGELLEDARDDRPEECECGSWNADAELPCWPCYREGFKSPAPEDEA